MKIYTKIFFFSLSVSYLWGYDSALISSNGKPIFVLDFYNQGQSTAFGGEIQTSPFTLSQAQKNEVMRAAQFWADILGANATLSAPIPLSVSTMEEANANAISYDIFRDSNLALFADLLNGSLTLQEARENLKNVVIGYDSQGNPVFPSNADLEYLGHINMGTLDWYIAPHPSVLPTNKDQYDTFSTFTHELFHALGLGATTSNGFNATFASNLNAYTRHLVDYRGIHAQSGMQILNSKDYEDNHGVFIVDSDSSMWGENLGGSLSNASGHAYFVGENVREVIKNATLGFDGFNGLPISGWEGGNAELSHIELDNSLMSHQTWINYLYFMEAELALLQDLGYSLDRKLYFGDSIYENGITWESTHGFNDRDSKGWIAGSYNPSTYGVGLHIYGRENTATQNHDILSKGIASSGIRIDGSENTLNLSSGTQIHMLGDYSSGILVAYGKNHTLNHNGEILAQGRDGIGIHIDFGDNEGGNSTEYRGSYMFASPDYEGLESQDFVEALEAYRLDGALVKNLNLGSTSHTQGNLAAIYIAENAFVENINIQNGAVIRGDIISQWNPNNSKLLPGYENRLFTTLNFGDSTQRSLAGEKMDKVDFVGGIYGYDSFRVKVNEDLALRGDAWVYDLENRASLELANSDSLVAVKNHFENASNATLIAPLNPQGKLNIALGNSANLGGNLKFYMAKGFYKESLGLDRGDLFLTDSSNPAQITGQFATIDYEDSRNLSQTLDFRLEGDRIEVTRDYAKFAGKGGDEALAGALESLALQTDSANPTARLFEEIDFAKEASAITKALDSLNARAYVNAAKASLDFQKRLNEDFLSELGGSLGRDSGKSFHSNASEWLVSVAPFGAYHYTKENGDFGAYKGYGGGIRTSATRNFGDSWNVGLHLIVNASRLEFQNNLESDVKSKGGYAGITTQYDLEKLYFFGSLRVGYENQELNRTLQVGSYAQSFSSDFNALTTSALLGVGKDFALSDTLSFSPLGYVEYNALHTPNITEEQDSSVALRVEDKNYYSLGGFVGAKVAWDKSLSNASTLCLSLLGGYYHSFNDTLKVGAAFKGDSSTGFYAQNSLKDRDSLRLQAKAGLAYPNGFFTNLSVQSDIKSHSDVYGKLEAGFRF